MKSITILNLPSPLKTDLKCLSEDISITAPRSLTVTGLTQNAGSEKKDPSYNYIDIIRELDKQSNKKSITIQVAEQTYNIKNPYGDSAYELSMNVLSDITN